jgi:N6-L-threonylcarbamoyladenine synthase
MLPLHKSLTTASRRHVTKRCGASGKYARGQSTRQLVTLAIETSCDDTSLAVAELLPGSGALKVHFHETITANNADFKGIHPLVALHSHRKSLAPLLQKALRLCPKPDLIAATRGPGMRSNLAVGLDTAKGLAVAFNKPFVGVHHMQAHALTPRLVGAINGSTEPAFPFLTVLVSGGHSLLLNSSTLLEHSILAENQDIALGACLDKAARIILPPALLEAPYGKALEQFGFPGGNADYAYTPPVSRQDELRPRKTVWNWALTPPLSASKSGEKTSRRMCFSFSGLLNNVERFMSRAVAPDGRSTTDVRDADKICIGERREMAREVQRVVSCRELYQSET